MQPVYITAPQFKPVFIKESRKWVYSTCTKTLLRRFKKKKVQLSHRLTKKLHWPVYPLLSVYLITNSNNIIYKQVRDRINTSFELLHLLDYNKYVFQRKMRERTHL